MIKTARLFYTWKPCFRDWVTQKSKKVYKNFCIVHVIDSNLHSSDHWSNFFVKCPTSYLIYLTGVFVGPQIRKIFSDNEFFKKLNRVEKKAWKSFISLCENFLGNNRSDNYVEVVNDFLKAYGEMGCRMSIKIHFLHSHLDFFPENLGKLSDEQGERFHQEISAIETRFVGKSQIRMLANYCWSLKRETNDAVYKRRRSNKHF